jgi:hypothetical protein
MLGENPFEGDGNWRCQHPRDDDAPNQLRIV